MKDFRIGFTTVTFRKKTPEEICKIAVKNRIQYLEWGTDVHVPTVKDAEKIRLLCDAYKLQTISLGAYHRIGIPSDTPFSETLESARILGASRIRVWLGKKSSADVSEAERNAYLEETRELLRMAEPYGIEISFEFHRKTLNDTGKSSFAFLQEAKHPLLSTYWQPFFHETPENEFPFDVDRENLLTVSPYISAAHVFSWDEASHRFPLAYHETAWHTFISLLKDTPCRDLIMEFVLDDNEMQFEEDLSVLRGILEKIK